VRLQQLASAIGAAIVTSIYFKVSAARGGVTAVTVSSFTVAMIIVSCLGLVCPGDPCRGRAMTAGLWLPVEISHLGDVSRCPEPESGCSRSEKYGVHCAVTATGRRRCRVGSMTSVWPTVTWC
jgi:hypothetical protein